MEIRDGRFKMDGENGNIRHNRDSVERTVTALWTSVQGRLKERKGEGIRSREERGG